MTKTRQPTRGRSQPAGICFFAWRIAFEEDGFSFQSRQHSELPTRSFPPPFARRFSVERHPPRCGLASETREVPWVCPFLGFRGVPSQRLTTAPCPGSFSFLFPPLPHRRPGSRDSRAGGALSSRLVPFSLVQCRRSAQPERARVAEFEQVRTFPGTSRNAIGEM